MVPCETNDLEVPANAEIVLEGYVNLNEMRTEGPFGDHTGFYSLEGSTRFSRGMCHAPQRTDLLDDSRGAAAAGRLLYGARGGESVLAVMKMQYPEIVDMAMPAEGIFQQPDDRGRAKSYPGRHGRS